MPKYSDTFSSDKHVIAAVDADLYAFRWAAAITHNVAAVTDAEFEAKLRKRFDEFVDELTLNVAPDEVVWAFSHTTNFRKSVNRCYKSNRSFDVNPMLGAQAKARELICGWVTPVQFLGLEADDILGIIATDPRDDAVVVIVSYDKDMRQLPATVYQTIDFKKSGVVTEAKGFYTVCQAEADEFYWKQVLMGDRVDGYFGIPGCGIKSATDFWDKHLRHKSDSVRWSLVAKEYEWHYLDEQYFARMARSARILRHGDYKRSVTHHNAAFVKLYGPADSLEQWLTVVAEQDCK